MNDELIRDIYERLGGIDAKLDDVKQIRDTANKAEKKADMALNRADETAKNLDRLSGLIKWAFGLIVTIVVPTALAVLNLLFG